MGLKKSGMVQLSKLVMVIAGLASCREIGAQPPDVITVPRDNPPQAHVMTTAERIAERQRWLTTAPPAELANYMLIYFIEGNLSEAAQVVAGADPHAPTLRELQQLIALPALPGNRVLWRVDLEQNPPLPPLNGPREATVTVQVQAEDILRLRIQQEETLPLRLEDGPQGKQWRIAPAPPEDVFRDGPSAPPLVQKKNLVEPADAPSTDAARVSAAKPDVEPVGVVRQIATYLAYPQQAWGYIGGRISQQQVKQLCLGLMQYIFDWNEKFPPEVATWHEKIFPYVKNTSLFAAPGDAKRVPGDVVTPASYSLNPRLAGKKLADVQDASHTVAIYLGHNEQLDFRFDGRTVVGFTDGHVGLLTLEEAKALRWNP